MRSCSGVKLARNIPSILLPFCADDCMLPLFGVGIAAKSARVSSIVVVSGFSRLYWMSFVYESFAIGRFANRAKRLIAARVISRLECGSIPSFPLMVLMWR